MLSEGAWGTRPTFVTGRGGATMPVIGDGCSLRRRYAYLLAFIYLVGLLALDLSLVLRGQKIDDLIHREIDERFRVPTHFQRIELAGLDRIRVSNILLEKDGESHEVLLESKELLLRFDPFSLLAGRVELNEAVLVRPIVHLSFDENGEIAFPKILREQESSASDIVLPTIVVRDLEMIFEDAPFLADDSPGVLSGIDLELQPRRSIAIPYSVRGVIDDPKLGHFEVAGDFGEAYLAGTVRRKAFCWDRSLADDFRPEVAEILRNVEMGGGIDLLLEISSRDRRQGVDLRLSADLHDLRLGYRGWPNEIERMEGSILWAGGSLRNRGPIDFELEGARLSVRKLDFDLGTDAVDYRVEGSLEGLEVTPAFSKDLARYPAPFPEVSDVLQALEVSGPIDADFTLRPDTKDASRPRVGVNVAVKFREAHLSYAGFKNEAGERIGYLYPLDHVTGIVDIENDHLQFTNIHSQADDQHVTAEGWVSYGREPLGYEVRVEGHGVMLDEKVAKALPPKDRAIYSSYQPQGPIDFDLSVIRPKGSPDSPAATFVADLRGCRAVPPDFPLPMDDLKGQLVFGDPRGTQVREVTARHGDARFKIGGFVNHSDPRHTTFELAIDAQDIDLDEELWTAMQPNFASLVDAARRFHPRGTVDVACQIDSGGEGGGNAYKITFNDVSFRHEDYPSLAFDHLDAVVDNEENPRLMRVREASLRCCDNAFRAGGWFELGRAAWEVQLDAAHFAIGPEALRSVETLVPELTTLTEAIQVEGEGGVTVSMKRTERGSYLRAGFVANGVTVRGTEIPFEITDIHGTLDWGDDAVVLRGWSGVVPLADGPLELGLIYAEKRMSKKPSSWTASGVGVKGFRFAEDVFAMLPEGMASGLRSLGARGSLDFSANDLRWGETLSFQAELSPHEIAIDPGIKVVLRSGRIDVEDAAFDAKGLEVHGRIKDAVVGVHAFDLSNLSAEFEFDSTSLGIRKIRGTAIGGRLVPDDTSWVMDFAAPRAFSASLNLREADLSRFMADLDNDPKTIDGKGSVRAVLSGNLDELPTWKGAGDVQLAGRRLYEIPFYAKALEILSFDFLTLGGDTTQTGTFDATVKDMRIILDRAAFRGPGVQLDGEGVIGFDGICRIDFQPKLIKWLDGIPIIGDIVSLTSGVFVSVVRVKGPIESLDAEVGNYITELMPSDPDSGRRLQIRPLKSKNPEEKKD